MVDSASDNDEQKSLSASNIHNQPRAQRMLSVFQTRTIQWDRGASVLDDAEMISIATAMLNDPVFWTELEIGKAQTHTFEYEGSRMFAVVDCLSPVDDIQLQILTVQYM